MCSLSAAASSAVRPVLAGPVRPARFLGVSPSALYLITEQPSGLLAVLAHDAVRLPCGLLLPTTSTEQPLTELLLIGRPEQVACLVGAGAVRWAGPGGPVVIHAVREWAPAQVSAGTVDPAALAQARAALPSAAAVGLGDGLVTALISAACATPAVSVAVAGARPATGAVAALLGRGPGLTPSGDDVLAGFLLGALAFGVPADEVCRTIAELAPTATTSLSAAMLWHAAHRRCVPEAAAFAAALTGRSALGPAITRLLAVGHSSGAALGLGLLAAADAAAKRSAEGQAA